MIDLNKLITAYRNSIKDSKWKPSVQSFNLNYLVEVNKAKNEIENGTTKLLRLLGLLFMKEEKLESLVAIL